MPQKRQAFQGGSEDTICVRSLGLRLPHGYCLEPHRHAWHQLVYGTEGVLTVDTSGGSWVVPAQRAVWIPAETVHSVRMTGQVRMRTIYVRPGAGDLPEHCCVVDVSPLLRELILETIRAGMLRDDVPGEKRLAAVLLDQIEHTREAPLQVTHPVDPRARRVVAVVLEDLALVRPIAQLVGGSGASVRTIERIFLRETGLTFGRWMQQVRALRALERLAAGDSVTEAGLAVGYESTSAFIAMFKRVLGATPGSYSSRQNGQSSVSG